MKKIFVALVFVGALLLAMLAACAPAPAAPAGPTIKITSPAASAKVSGPKVKIEVDIQNFKMVDANQAIKDGEGHLHFFIDVPASAVAVGQVVPLDDATKYVHAGKAPYTSREIELSKGQHTLTAVMANSAHAALAQPAPVSVTFTVE